MIMTYNVQAVKSSCSTLILILQSPRDQRQIGKGKYSKQLQLTTPNQLPKSDKTADRKGAQTGSKPETLMTSEASLCTEDSQLMKQFAGGNNLKIIA